MYHNFAIVGFGGSGTKFLCQTMNLSKKWNVVHEAWPSTNFMDARFAQDRFKKDYYGEVNGYLRFCLDNLNVEKRGVLIRHPRQMCWSWYEHRVGLNDQFYKNLDISLKLMDQSISNGAKIIVFEKMISNINYLKEICEWFGIDDIDYSKVIINKKVNPHRGKKYISYNDIPKVDRDIINSTTDWFKEKYYK